MPRVRCYSAVVKVKTTTAQGGAQVVLTEAGVCVSSQADTKTVT